MMQLQDPKQTTVLLVTLAETTPVLEAANLQPEIESAELRLEAGDPVSGLVVRATKPAGAGMNHA